MHIINDFALALLRVNTVDEILWLIAKHAIAQLEFLDCVIYLLDDTGEMLVQRAAHGPKNPQDKEILAPITIPLGQGIVGTVAVTGKPELILDTRQDPRYIIDDDIRLSELAVPIFYRDEVIGVIDSEHPEARFYSTEHLEILTTIGAMASTSIATALTVERLKETVDALHAAQQELKLLAHQDSLTGLLNRRAFDHLLEQAIQQARHEGKAYALAFLDVDMLKTVNEICGHQAGDELLRQLTRLFRINLQPQHQLARIGGDEFMVLMADCSLPQAEQLMETIRNEVEQFRFVWNDQPIHVGVSIGLMALDDSCPDSVTAHQQVDTALMLAKESGRNRIQVYSADQADAIRHSEASRWVQRVGKEIDADNFVLFYQSIRPIQAPESQSPCCFEVLLRLRNHDGNFILPGVFLPAAERYGLSARLDRYVLEKAITWLEANQAMLPARFQLNINISAYSLDNPNIIGFIRDILSTRNLPAQWLCLEITETAAISNFSRAIEFIEALKALGCRFALDDFGSGIATVNYLRQLPVDLVKIDGSLIRQLNEDPISQHLVQSFTDIAHLLSHQVVAEHVENEATRQQLKTIGVDYAQGFHIARPAPMDSLRAALAQNHLTPASHSDIC